MLYSYRLYRLILIAAIFCGRLYASTFYVAPTGFDTNTGTFQSPFFTVMKAVSLCQPGDTVYMRGGTYFYLSAQQLDANGTVAQPIIIRAYAREIPVMDGTMMTYSTANERKSRRGFMLYGNHYRFYGIHITRMPDNGMRIKASNITVENCVFFYNRNTGLQIGLEGSSTNDGTQVRNNTVINCDSYRNCDSAKSGGDADGFACKLNAGTGNVFRGCRAWENSDDGFDLFQQNYAVVLDECRTWHNGDGSLFPDIPGFSGNGNGFKAGGLNSHGFHYITRCISFNNKYSSSGRGFDQNSHKSGMMIAHCLSFGNKTNYYFPGAPNDTTAYDFLNNVSFGAVSSAVSTPAGAVLRGNTWTNSGINASADDYADLSEALAAAPRNTDGSLPTDSFSRLLAQSDLIDKGVQAGYPFSGSAPEPGPYEFFITEAKSVNAAVNLTGFPLVSNFPNPFNPSTVIRFYVPLAGNVNVTIYGVNGEVILRLIDDEFLTGYHEVKFNASGLSSGPYFVVLRQNGNVVLRTIQLVK